MIMSDLQNGAAYIRVSTHDQEELSPDAQKRLILDYAKQHHIFIAPDDIYIESCIYGMVPWKGVWFYNHIFHGIWP